MKKEHITNQYGQNYRLEYVLDIEPNSIRRNNIPKILGVIGDFDIKIERYALSYADDLYDSNTVTSETPAGIAIHFWSDDIWLNHLLIYCEAHRFRFSMLMPEGERYLHVFPEDRNFDHDFMDSLVSAIENALNGK